MLFTILLIALAIYYFWGFSPGRRIERQNGFWHAVGFIGTKKVLWFVDGDRGLLPYPMPFGFVKVKIRNAYTTFFRKNLPKKNGTGGEIIDDDPKPIPGTNEQIVLRSDLTDKLPKRNKQVLMIEVKFPKAALTFYFVLGAVFLFDKRRALKKYLNLREGIVTYTQREIEDAVGPGLTDKESKWYAEWLSKKGDEEHRTEIIGKNGEKIIQEKSFGLFLIEKLEAFRIDDVTSLTVPAKDENGNEIAMPLVTYLDTQKFNEHGFKIGELSLSLGYGKDAEALLNERRKQQILTEERTSAIKKESVKEIERLTLENNAKTEAAVIDTVWQKQKEVVNGIAQAQKEANGGYQAQVLSIGAGAQTNIADAIAGVMVGKTMDLKPKTKQTKGGTNEQTDTQEASES